MDDQSSKFTPDEAPTLEIGPERELMSLSHEEQVEIALSVLDFGDGETSSDNLKEGGAEPSGGLDQVAIDPDFIIVERHEVIEDVITSENPPEDRPTIIPDIPITMEDLEPLGEDVDSSPTRPYPPEFKYIGDFMTSNEMLQYETALHQHRRAVEIHLSGISRGSTMPEPPHFHEYFQRFLTLRAARPQSGGFSASSSVSRRPASQSGRYSLLLGSTDDEETAQMREPRRHK